MTNAVSDSIWRVEIDSGRTSGTALQFPQYRKPRAPSHPLRTPPELNAWAKEWHMSNTLSVGSCEVAVPFVQGILNYGDPMVLLSQDHRGEWHALTGAPPIIHATEEGRLVSILNPNQDAVVLGIYERKAP